MQFNFSYSIDREFIERDVQRFIDFLREHDVDTLTNLKISCYPWRNDIRLQAVNEDDKIRPITFSLALNDERCGPQSDEALLENVSVRERPDDLGEFGLATAFNHDD